MSIKHLQCKTTAFQSHVIQQFMNCIDPHNVPGKPLRSVLLLHFCEHPMNGHNSFLQIGGPHHSSEGHQFYLVKQREYEPTADEFNS
jgi:hypothetical protein